MRYWTLLSEFVFPITIYSQCRIPLPLTELEKSLDTDFWEMSLKSLSLEFKVVGTPESITNSGKTILSKNVITLILSWGFLPMGGGNLSPSIGKSLCIKYGRGFCVEALTVFVPSVWSVFDSIMSLEEFVLILHIWLTTGTQDWSRLFWTVV